MALLADLVAVSRRVAATSARRVKVRELGEFLKSLPAADIDAAAQYLSGDIPQGRIGIGYSALKKAVRGAAAEPGLSIGEVDRRIGEIAGIQGSGSAARNMKQKPVIPPAPQVPVVRSMPKGRKPGRSSG